MYPQCYPLKTLSIFFAYTPAVLVRPIDIHGNYFSDGFILISARRHAASNSSFFSKRDIDG
jgi:hypothetical protein